MPQPRRPTDSFDFSALDGPDSISRHEPGPFDFSVFEQPDQPPDSRSTFARVIDRARTPLLPELAEAAKAVAERLDRPRVVSGGILEGIRAIPDVLRNLVTEPGATMRGFAAGAIEGAGDVASSMTAPLDLALMAAGPAARVARTAVARALPAIQDAERAIVAARAAGRLDDVPRLQRELEAARASAGGAEAMYGGLRGAETLASAALAGRGIERLADAESSSEGATGILEATMGAAGVRSARAHPPMVPARPVRGRLPPGARFVATETGTVAPFGSDIPVSPTPDRSFVRAVPGEYARREPRALLTEGARFVAPEQGPAARVDQAAELPSRRIPDASDSAVRAVPASIVDRDFEGAMVTRKVFSSDPEAASTPLVNLSTEELRELRRMVAELDAVPFTRHTFNEIPRGRGGDVEVVPGAAGAPVYRDVLAVRGRTATRNDVQRAIERFVEGHHSALGQDALEIARLRLAGDRSVSKPILPPEYGDPNYRPPDPDDAAFDDFGRLVDTLGPADEPGQAGFARNALVQRGAGAAAGSLYGGATGEDAGDRLQRAAVYGVAGALAPSLVRSGAGPRFLTPTSTETPRPIRIAEIRPVASAEAPRLASGVRLRPITDPMRGIDPLLERFPEPIREGVRQTLEANGGFATQRRGVIPQQETERLAQQMAVDVSRTLRPGTALNAEQLRSYANATATVQSKVRNLSARVTHGQNSDADLLALHAAKEEHAVLLASLMGARAEAGRALASFRMFANVLDTGDVNLIRAAINAPGLRREAQQLAGQVAQLPDDPIARYGFLQGLRSSSVMDKIRSYYYANILSGVKTHERNFIGNAFSALTNLAVTPAAAATDVVRSTLTRTPREVFTGELPHQAIGALVGIPRGLQEFAFALRYGVSRSSLARSVTAAETRGKFDVPRTEFAGGGGNPFNWPGRLLESADAFFRAINRNSELYAGAYAQAKREGRSGQALLDRIVELRTGDGHEALRLQAQADTFAQRAVFQESGGPLVGWLQAGAKQFPALSFVIPFIRTPANIFRQGAEFSPAGAVMKAARQGGRAGSQAQGRVLAGSLAAAPLAWLAASGRLSGSGPRDPSERAAKMEAGWRPDSVKLRLSPVAAERLSARGGISRASDGEYWVSYQLFQPVSVPASIIANAFESWMDETKGKEAPSLNTAAIASARVARSMLNQSMLSGLFDVLDAVNDPDRWASRYLGRLAHSLTPFAGAQRTVAQAIDPTVRQPQGLGEVFRSNVPGLSQSLEPRVTRFGEPVQAPGGPLARAADPLNVSPVVNDRVAAELHRLGVPLSLPSERVTLPDGGSLSRRQALELKQSKGREVRARLEALLDDPAWIRLDDEDRRALLLRAISGARRDVSRSTRRQWEPDPEER